MRNIIVILFVFLFFQINIVAANDIYYINPDGTRFNNSISYPRISQIEKKMFSKTYGKEPVDTRLNRLEKAIYRRTFSKLSLSERVEQLSYYFEQKEVSRSDRNNLKAIEKKVLGQTFDYETLSRRLERLEAKVLGCCQGGGYKERINKLKNATITTSVTTQYAMPDWNYYNSTPTYSQFNNIKRYDKWGKPILSPKYPNRIIRNPIGALRSFLGGTMTGYTLPVQNYYQTHNPNAVYHGTNSTGKPTNFFSTGSDGEMYYNNGEYYRYNTQTDGGIGVKIIQD